MLATLTHERFSDPDWVYERKLDGERCIAVRAGARVRLASRNQRPLDATYPELVLALAEQPSRDFVVDGEIVAFEGARTSFARLSERMQVRDAEAARRSGIAVYLYLFDVLHLDGQRTTALDLRDRKALLRRAFVFGNRVRFTPHRNAEGERFLEEACRKGWEGLIAKRAASPYVYARSRDWLKLKCANRQELVIGGYTDPRGGRAHFGALLLGYHEMGALVYAGKVGTGFDDETLAALGAKLERRERATPPFAQPVPAETGVHWVRPDLVAEIAFTEWTRDGRLRHPSFLGLRDDKDASEVVRERPRGRPTGG
jgi:DNA ligase D-like protein (predicted ligase)